ncbi:MAG: hypothetical protein N4J56_006697 [Chroococcidiopsis sp. SAG 2025]|nr:hypothetical protein [Chroococcidiopsis sp. SAG 2025]
MPGNVLQLMAGTGFYVPASVRISISKILVEIERIHKTFSLQKIMLEGLPLYRETQPAILQCLTPVFYRN